MNELKIQELKNGLKEMMTLVYKKGKPISNEMKLKISQVIEHVANRIKELRMERQVSTDQLNLLPEQAPIQQAMPSSNVYGYNYDKDTGNLLVKFQGNGGIGEGPVYKYEGVPQVMFDLFRKGAVPARTDGKNKWGKWWKGKHPSIGASMYTLIANGGYPYQRVS
jgi:hypothetical protein